MSNPNLPPSPIQLFDWIAVLQCVAIKESRDGFEAGHIVQQGLRVSMEGMTVTNIGQHAWDFTCFMRGKRGKPAWLAEELEICG